ncbi:MAG: ABC transporter permease [Saprospiraceae bacterium]
MKILIALLKKEFKQIFRDKAILKLIFIMPIIQLLVLPFAADYEIKNIKVGVIDHDHSTYAQQLLLKIEHSAYFQLAGVTSSKIESQEWLANKSADLIVEIPSNFENTLVRDKKADLLIAVNAADGTKGNIGALYISQIIRNFNKDIRKEWLQFPRFNPQSQIDIVPTQWYNPQSSYQVFMVPGILSILLTLVGMFLTSLNIVKEKEIGTIEQINVSPIKKYQFILGKLIPFLIIGIGILTIGVFISYVVHGIVPQTNIWVLYVFSAFYLFAVLGFGLLISNFTNSQQQAMMIAFFFMLIFILMSGLYTPIESMPSWGQTLAYINPVTYMVDASRMVLLKGAQLSDIIPHIKVIALEGIVLNTMAIWSYSKQN